MAKNSQRSSSSAHAQGNNPFAKMVSDLNAPWFSAVKQAATQYIDTTEKWAQQALEWNEKTTEWAKATPLAPFFETQQLIARQTIELSADLARRLWQIETEVEEKVAETMNT